MAQNQGQQRSFGPNVTFRPVDEILAEDDEEVGAEGSEGEGQRTCRAPTSIFDVLYRVVLRPVCSKVDDDDATKDAVPVCFAAGTKNCGDIKEIINDRPVRQLGATVSIGAFCPYHAWYTYRAHPVRVTTIRNTEEIQMASVHPLRMEPFFPLTTFMPHNTTMEEIHDRFFSNLKHTTNDIVSDIRVICASFASGLANSASQNTTTRYMSAWYNAHAKFAGNWDTILRNNGQCWQNNTYEVMITDKHLEKLKGSSAAKLLRNCPKRSAEEWLANVYSVPIHYFNKIDVLTLMSMTPSTYLKPGTTGTVESVVANVALINDGFYGGVGLGIHTHYPVSNKKLPTDGYTPAVQQYLETKPRIPSYTPLIVDCHAQHASKLGIFRCRDITPKDTDFNQLIDKQEAMSY